MTSVELVITAVGAFVGFTHTFIYTHTHFIRPSHFLMLLPFPLSLSSTVQFHLIPFFLLFIFF